MTGKLFFIIILMVVISTGSMLFLKLPPLKLPQLELSLSQLTDFFKPNPATDPATDSSQLKYQLPKPSSASPTPTAKPKSQLTPKTSATSKKAVPVVIQPKECYRYQITHLDGSTSNLCYSQADHNQLISLGYQLASAKAFYQFHLDGVARYQKEYEKTGSSIYLDAKASQQSQADSEKVKIDQITVQMYNLEAKGY